MSFSAGARSRLDRAMSGRSAFAWAYLGCYLAAGLAWALLTPRAQAALIALALFGANRVLGNARTALTGLAGHVIGSLVSEGIVAYRVDAGQLPVTGRYLTEVGPWYVVVSAIVIAVMCGTWLSRAAAALDFAVLVIGGHIFGGLSHLEVAAV